MSSKPPNKANGRIQTEHKVVLSLNTLERSQALNSQATKPTSGHAGKLTTHSCTLAKALFAVSVVKFSLLRVRKNIVGKVDFFELRIRVRVIPWLDTAASSELRKRTHESGLPYPQHLGSYRDDIPSQASCRTVERTGKKLNTFLFFSDCLRGLRSVAEQRFVFKCLEVTLFTFFMSASLAFWGTPRISYNRVSAILSKWVQLPRIVWPVRDVITLPQAFSGIKETVSGLCACGKQ